MNRRKFNLILISAATGILAGCSKSQPSPSMDKPPTSVDSSSDKKEKSQSTEPQSKETTNVTKEESKMAEPENKEEKKEKDKNSCGGKDGCGSKTSKEKNRL